MAVKIAMFYPNQRYANRDAPDGNCQVLDDWPNHLQYVLDELAISRDG
jgi:hypothetical protein